MSELEILAPDPKRHSGALTDLVARTFPHGGYWSARDDFARKCGPLGRYDWAVSRIGLLDGRVVTHWGVWEYPMRIGAAVVRAGGIGNVATDGDCRERGYMTRTGEASIEAMRAAGYDLSILYGRPDFYHRYGYVPAWPEATWTADLADLPAARPTVRLRPMPPARRPDADATYNREHRGLTGTAVRPTYRAKRWHDLAAFWWADGRGRLAGYLLAARQGDAAVWYESGGSPPEVLRILARLARRWTVREVRFKDLHWGEPLARHLRRLNCRLEERRFRNGGPMVLAVNLQATLHKMAGELERRLAASCYAGWAGRLLVDGGRGAATLAIERGQVRVGPAERARHALRGGDWVAQLLIGSEEPAETFERGRMRFAGDARGLAAALFPAQRPHLNAWDRF
jgi:hypothetical protein